MPLTCARCGRTNIPTGSTQCPICNAALSAAMMSATVSASKGTSAATALPAQLIGPKGRRWQIYASSAAVIGSRGCAIMLSEPGIPPQAARITPCAGGFLLEDVGGAPRLNGAAVTSAAPLKHGDKISVGSTDLTYQGPNTPPTSLLPVVSAPAAKAPVVVPPPPPAPTAPAVMVLPPPPLIKTPPPPYALKSWMPPLPAVEGSVDLVDGPHRVEKGNIAGKFVAAAFLGVATKGMLSFLPFMGKQDTDVRFLRVKDRATGRMFNVVMRGEPSGMIQMGDFVAIWGKVDSGNVLMEFGYNYVTDSEIRLRR